MKNRVKVTIAALTVGLLTVCTGITGYAVEDQGATDKTNMKYSVTYDYNNGSDNEVVEFPKQTGSLELKNSTPKKEGYELTGWWYVEDEYHKTEEKFDKDATIKFADTFKDDHTPTLVAEWTQVVTVKVNGTESGTVKAGNVYSVTPAASDNLKLDKWLLNGEKIEHGEDNKGTIEVKATEAENHVIKVDGEKTRFGITSENPYANLDSYWSPQSGYLVNVTNETGHPLKFSEGTLNDTETSRPEFFKIITDLPEKTKDGYFTILKPSIKEHVANQDGDYVTYDRNNVKAYNLTLSASDVQRNIKISFDTKQAGVSYTEPKVSECILKGSNKLTPQALLNTANVTAKRDGFTKYRWTYSVKDAEKWVSAKEIPSGVWSEQSSEETDILNKKFDYSFPYYEFEFKPVWQGDVKFELEIPTGESAKTPDAIEGVDVGTEITLPDGPEIKGYTFNGWKLDVPTDAAYKPESSYEVTSANVTFTGSWTVNKYKITWNQGDNESKFDPREVEYKSPVELPIPEKTGYTFTGWKSDVEGDDTLYNKDKSFTMPSHNVTMTAQWQINTYTVTYNGNGGTIGIYTGEDKVTYNAPYEIKNVSGITPTRFGYKFLGWRKNNEGNLLQAGDSFKMPDDNVELVAQWAATSSKSYKMEQGVGYTYNGAFRIKGDPSNYQDKITFYVPKAGEYTFE